MKKTPMMQQYDRAKQECGDALLLFRMGDFYELFHEDAEIAAKTLGLTLTSRDKSANAAAMAGFPHHQLDSYMGKLIKQGFRVAVCEQVEDPKTAKGLVKREISQIVSPGTVTDANLLDPTEANFLAAIAFPDVDSRDSKLTSPGAFGLSWTDLSTGQFVVACVERNKLLDLVARLGFREILISESDREQLSDLLDSQHLSIRPTWTFARKHALDLLHRQLQVASLSGFGLTESDSVGVRAAGAVLQYIKETQNSSLAHIDHLQKFSDAEFVELDPATWRSLEISRTIRSGQQDGSLFSVINRCVTPMGSRELGSWLTMPLREINQINERQEAVDELAKHPNLRAKLRSILKEVFDLQRLVGRITTGRCTPRELSRVATTLGTLPSLKAQLTGRTSPLLQQLESELDLCVDLRSELDRALSEECSAQTKDGGFIRAGFSDRLDELRKLATGGKQWIANYQQKICEETGIGSLKVGFNKVFGYYLEVTHTHVDRVPGEFIRKQTLKNAERYITPELKEYEEKVLSADEQALALELELFTGLLELVASYASRLKLTAQILATLDVLAGFAELAVAESYCRPEIVPDQTLEIVGGRHPVLDIVEPTGAFIPNDTTIGSDSGFVHLITGPNMAGKSTYIRQVALITLMAQTGSFVPATEARIGIVDRIFARIGASDELTSGQSTFMVEMTETARILNTASENSLVILDEIGRGTSTYDGVSLAWSIVEFIHDHIGCRTLFATHYHELTELESTLPGVCNYNVAVQEWHERIVFLHKINPGPADQSYGIHVARLAGVPDWVNQRAGEILERLESEHSMESNRESVSRSAKRRPELQMTLFEVADHPVIEKIRELDIDRLSPIKALEMLNRWKTEIEQQPI